MKSMLNDFLKAVDNPFATIAEDAQDITGWVDTGSYALNALVSGSIYGGFPANKIVAIGADPSTGKTFFALSALKHFQETNPTGLGVIFESESAITRSMLVERGIDVSRLLLIPVVTVQDFRTAALKILENYEKRAEADRVPLFFILDSLGMLSTTKELADSTAGAETKDMTRAALLKAAFRVLTLRLGQLSIPMVVTNHVYEDVGGGPYAQKVQGGGSGMIYAASTILTLSKARERDASTNEVTGVVVTVTATKSRLTREQTKVKCLIRFDGGLDRYFWLTEIAERAGIFKKNGTRYEINGKMVFGKTIRENPTEYFTPEVLDKIDAWVQENFKYTAGSTPLIITEEEEQM